ncbi:MAG TPA: DUF2818 family protein [Acidiferrobacteraceae bacterium]|nr:DUF2818 family protein [Acidiferrobacteraceae bacterium]
MSIQSVVWILLGLAFIAANLPWLTERFFFVLSPPGGVKKVWMRLVEWAVLFLVIGLIAMALEHKLMGVVHDQGWEFYAVGVCLFLVFALPGFIYRHELSRYN